MDCVLENWPEIAEFIINRTESLQSLDYMSHLSSGLLNEEWLLETIKEREKALYRRHEEHHNNFCIVWPGNNLLPGVPNLCKRNVDFVCINMYLQLLLSGANAVPFLPYFIRRPVDMGGYNLEYCEICDPLPGYTNNRPAPSVVKYTYTQVVNYYDEIDPIGI